MRKISYTLGLFLLVSLFAAGAYAAGPAKGKERKVALYNGLVVAIDNKAKTLTVAKANSELGMLFNTSRAAFSSGYKNIGDVMVGDQVTVKFEAKIGTTYALDIAKGKKAAKEAKPTTKANLSPADK